MGTAITLTLNGINIDWGKNRFWRSHHWLFPPGSLMEIPNYYARGEVRIKPGFETTLGAALFRLRHLGFSQQEARDKFDAMVARWNRTSELHLTYDEFRGALSGVDFASLTQEDLEPYIWDFRAFMLNLLEKWDTSESSLEDFIGELDFPLTLRALADREDSASLPLRWHHQDLVDSGWASLEDLTDIDRPDFIINHTVLFGRLQDHSGRTDIRSFDKWLHENGLARATLYRRTFDRRQSEAWTTLPVAVRNMIHHPENPLNSLTDAALRESVEMMLEVAAHPDNSISGLT